MPVEFLTDEEAAAYGRFKGVPSRAELERAFFLDDVDKALIAKRRGDHNRLGFALQLTTVRWLGTFLPDPLDVPDEVVAYLAEQLRITDVSCAGRYTERRTTRFEHVGEIKQALGLKDFSEVDKKLEAWVDARAWTTGDGPKAVFSDTVSWLAERGVLLPGVTTLAQLVARVRDQATQWLWETLYDLLNDRQRRVLEVALEVTLGGQLLGSGALAQGSSQAVGQEPGAGAQPGRRDRRRRPRVPEPGRAVVPHRRLAELARYGMAAKTAQLRHHPVPRKLATLLATVVHLEAKAVDDCLELLDLLMVTKLLGKAEREANAERLRQHPRLARASATLAQAMRVVLEASDGGEEVSLVELWQAIEAVASRVQLESAVAAVDDLVPSPRSDDEEATRTELATRIMTVSGFLKTLTEVIAFEANAEAAPVLAAMKCMPALLRGRHRLTTTDIDESLVRGSWKRLVFGVPPADGTIDKASYVFCVLTQFHRHLKRGDIYAEASGRWRDPRAALLDGGAWANAKAAVLTALSLPGEWDKPWEGDQDGIMPEPDLPTSSTVYQLRVVLRGISPLIWRRLLVRSDTTVAGLHAIFQAAFSWDGSHLHRFVVHGTEYGICYYGGTVFRDEAAKVSLADLGLGAGERFHDDYDFTDDWRHDIRIERISDSEPRDVYPVCTGGRRAGPPEDCGGPLAFLDQTQP